MFSALKQLLGARAAPPPPPPVPRIPAGQRIYAIGDIHGRLDLFTALAQAIETDDAARGPADTTVILLGDLVDRGPDSASVVEAALSWSERRRVRILMGNHEEMMLQSLDNLEVMRVFLRHGGRETLMSYGVPVEILAEGGYEAIQSAMRACVPAEALDFVAAFEDQIWIGDYMFVHAGVRPGVWLESQKRPDLRWIREPFLSADEHHGAMIVHGHTITDGPELRPNRIGIDTGAYASGVLTGLVLEDDTRHLIEARVVGDDIRTLIAPA